MLSGISIAVFLLPGVNCNQQPSPVCPPPLFPRPIYAGPAPSSATLEIEYIKKVEKATQVVLLGLQQTKLATSAP